MYRLLAPNDLVCERRRGHRHLVYEKPELLAEEPNQLWSWDITRLKGPRPGVCFYLYVILDVFSRYVPGYLIAQTESADLAQKLVETTVKRQGIAKDQLILHADRGAPMKAETLARLLKDLGVKKSSARPRVSDDNPYSEAQFKTVKYHPPFPNRFETIEQARVWARAFFAWYNHHHYHSALALLTPASVHDKTAEQIRQNRQTVPQTAFDRHPERFVKGAPLHPKIPDQVWINPPEPQPKKETLALL
jgi:transposase InsO family protein